MRHIKQETYGSFRIENRLINYVWQFRDHGSIELGNDPIVVASCDDLADFASHTDLLWLASEAYIWRTDPVRKAGIHGLNRGKMTVRRLSGLKWSSATITSTSMTCPQPARTEVTPTPFENCWSCIDSNGVRGTATPHPRGCQYPRTFYAFVC